MKLIQIINKYTESNEIIVHAKSDLIIDRYIITKYILIWKASILSIRESNIKDYPHLFNLYSLYISYIFSAYSLFWVLNLYDPVVSNSGTRENSFGYKEVALPENADM